MLVMLGLVESQGQLMLVMLELLSHLGSCAGVESQSQLMRVMLGLSSQRGKRRLADARDAWARRKPRPADAGDAWAVVATWKAKAG